MAKYIDRFSVFDRVMHWTLVVAFLVLVLSGLGLYSRAFFGYFTIFGGPQSGIVFHKWASIFFLSSSVLLFLSNFRETITFDEDDRRWFKAAGGYLSREKTHIPQGKFNAGQKLFGIFSIVGTLALALSGLIIWDPTFFSRGLTQFSLMIHGLFFTLFMMAAIVHIYLATVGNPGTSAGMLWGQVTRTWAKKHASKWYKKVAKG